MDVISIIGKILTLAGSLGLFLYGMKLMSDALQKVAGSRMRHILAAMTNSRIKGVFTGMLITTTIQSSSATTVMIVSFVNAGLLSLVAAVGVIMGANIGTTVTAWLISLLGFKISLSFLSLPLIGLSLPFFFSKNSLRKSWGEFIIGFAILFIGLQFLKEAVPDIHNNPDSLHFLSSFTDHGFFSVLIFVAIGTILTIIIQSSSATMALTLVMCYNGLIPFELAAAMVLGENIGTTITANLSAIVANVSAKRAARAHLLFNLFGVVWMLAVFHYFLVAINYFLQKKHGVSILTTHLSNTEFEDIKSVYPIALSLFHTTFNVINTLMLIGFAPFIAKLATMMVPRKTEDDEEFSLKYIKSGLFSTSELSILQARKEISNFGVRVENMFYFLQTLQTEIKPKKYYKLISKIEKHEQITDDLELEIAQYLTNIAEGEISHDSSKKIRAMLKMIDELESIADVIYSMSKIFDKVKEKKVKFLQHQKDSLQEMFDLLTQTFGEMNLNLGKGFSEVDTAKAFALEERINEKRDQLRQQHVEDLKEKRYKHKTGAFYSDLFSLSERIGDYILNVNETIKEYQETA
ncbi:MAG: Na/Pi cotransporter family protein [Bacteroidia bacterium]|nr:Na/Pi cotransporter family protein [Bacteroidia bacterium]